MDDIRREGLFEEYFCIRERFIGKHLILCGLNENTKKAVMFLAHFGVHVEGILAGNSHRKLVGCHYIGIPIIGIPEDAGAGTEYTLVDVFGDNSYEMNFGHKYFREVLFPDFGRVVIYGAGQTGQKLVSFLRQCDIDICCFIDRKVSLQDKEIDGIRVASPRELERLERNVHIIVAIQDEMVSDELVGILRQKGYTKVTYFNSVFFEITFCFALWECRKGENLPVFWPFCLRYIYRFSEKQNKKLYLYSEDAAYLQNVCMVMRCLGIQIDAGFTACIPQSAQGEVEIKDVRDLLCEESDNYLVWCLLGDVESGRQFMKQSGLNERNFVYSSTSPSMLAREYIMDTNTGYADARGTRLLKKFDNSAHGIRLAILGNSTSDYDSCYERLWTEKIVDLASEAGIDVEVYVAATVGNSSAQELMRLIRDVIAKNPDIVISYSGINEVAFGGEKHLYTHPYMKRLFDNLVSSGKGVDFFDAGIRYEYSMGEGFSNRNYWIENERMMHAICSEFGIAFLCILQPYLFTKKYHGKNEIELIEHTMTYWKGNATEQIERFYETTRNCIRQYPWIYDFTSVFDETEDEVYIDLCHVTEDMNFRLAQKIINIIIQEGKN